MPRYSIPWQEDLAKLSRDFKMATECRPIIKHATNYSDGWRKIMKVYNTKYGII